MFMLNKENKERGPLSFNYFKISKPFIPYFLLQYLTGL